MKDIEKVSIIVIVGYGDNNTKKLCTNNKYAKKVLGDIVAERLMAVMSFIESASSLNDIACFPSYRLHPLKANKKGLLAMDLGRRLGFRLIIKPDPPLNLEDDSLELHSKCNKVKSIKVIEVTNHYE
jgi:proteic killer suppression protein